MATLDELQAQLDKLTQRVNEITAPPDDYYTHRFSGEEIDNAVGRVADTIEDANNPGCYYHMVGGVQEWINPPMVPGVEYRTAKRNNGKPVYINLHDIGPLPNNTIKEVVFGTTVDRPISCQSYTVRVDNGWYQTINGALPLSYGYADVPQIIASAYWMDGRSGPTIGVWTNKALLDGYNCYAIVEYTKITD